MKIKVCFPYYGDSVGGSHISSLALYHELLKSTHFSPLIVLHNQGTLSRYLDQMNVDYSHIPLGGARSGSIKELPNIIFSLFKTVPFLLRNNIQIVHTNDSKMHMTWSIACYLSGKFHIWHQRTFKLSRKIVPFTFFSRRIIAISRYNLENLPDFTKGKSVLIYNPIGLEQNNPNEETELRIQQLTNNHNCKLVLFIGNLIPIKRPELFIKVAKEILSKKPKTIFALLGEKREPLYSECAALIKNLGLEKNVFLLGFESDVIAWLKHSDIYIAPGINEAFGRTLAEAFLCKTPVIASPYGAHKEVLDNGRAGIVVESDETCDYAIEAINILDNKESIENKILHGLEMLKYYDTKTHARKVEEVYKALAKFTQ